MAIEAKTFACCQVATQYMQNDALLLLLNLITWTSHADVLIQSAKGGEATVARAC